MRAIFCARDCDAVGTDLDLGRMPTAFFPDVFDGCRSMLVRKDPHH
jgi:hypothetical protein